MAHIKRLERLVTVLERVQADPKKRRRFNMSAWAQEIPECGTVMCAVGWGATDPVLKRQGLWLVAVYNDRGASSRHLYYNGTSGMRAAEMFFEIETWEAGRLFGCHAYRSLTSMAPVIARIKRFIRDAKKAEVSQ